MGKVALYRKYRSRDFGELIGQEHISKTLEKAVESGRISHAYLFTGPRGTGKTSVARIMARRINQIESGSTDDEVDIIEIDAASNNGVDEIRELRDKVHIAPNYRDYKVYIIDEVHMLSTAAFNALLKTLEEPPGHVIFIMATTEPHKLPQTIISRTQHFPFRPVAINTVINHLQSIAKEESISIDDEALKLLAELGEGSVRDSLTMLDQLAGGDDITVDTVRSMVGHAHYPELDKLLDAVLNRQTDKALAIFDSLIETGVSPRHLSRQLLDVTRSYVRSHLKDSDLKLHNARQLLSSLSALPNHLPNQALAIEAILLQICFVGNEPEAESGKTANFQASTATQSRPKRSAQPKKASKEKADKQPRKASQQPTDRDAAPDKVWVKALSLIKHRHPSLYGLLRQIQPVFKDNTCVLQPKFQFHYRQLQNERNFSIIETTLRQAGGEAMTVKLKPAKSSGAKPEAEAEQSDNELIGQVMDILGGEEIE